MPILFRVPFFLSLWSEAPPPFWRAFFSFPILRRSAFVSGLGAGLCSRMAMGITWADIGNNRGSPIKSLGANVGGGAGDAAAGAGVSCLGGAAAGAGGSGLGGGGG